MKSSTLDSAMLYFTGVLISKEAKTSSLNREVYEWNMAVTGKILLERVSEEWEIVSHFKMLMEII